MAMWEHREMLAPPAKAPEFSLKDMVGKSHSLANILAHGPTLLAFFKVSCPVCQYTFPFLERIYQGSGREKGAVQIIGVSQDPERQTVDFRREFGITFPMLLDEASETYPASNEFGISSVPSLFIIEQDGKISMSGAGFAKKDLEMFGHRMGVAPFHPGERVPEQKPG